jgi:predicted transcriptional regulator
LARASDPLPSLTGPELDVMKALWGRGPLGARELHEAVGESLDWAYSTTRTTVERMVRKGLVAKRSFHGLFLYSASISRARGLAGLVREFASRVLESEPEVVVSLFSERGPLDDEEIAELHAILEAAGAGDDE